MGNNAIVGQSGGPTSVINASLAGVFQACVMRGANRVYGMLNGVEGLLNERVADLTATLGSSLEIELLKLLSGQLPLQTAGQSGTSGSL